MLVPKLFTCMKGYTKEQFIKEIIAGFIVAVIALPLSIALAIASGVSPEKGLYTAIIGGFIVSFFGGSRVQIGGPTGAFIIIVYGIVQKYGITGLTVATMMAGIFLIIMGIFKFGHAIKYIPYPITTGFTSGIAVCIFSTQIKDLFGLSIQTVPAQFIPKWASYISHASTINLQATFIGILSIAIILLWPKINKKVPGTLIALIVTTLMTIFFKLNIETIGSRFGNISSKLPTIAVHNINMSMINELILPALTIAILAAIESLLSAVVADGMIGGNHRSNMELVAEGLANLFSGLFGGIPVTGAIARTAANVKNGGRTPITGIFHAIFLLLIMLLFMPYVKLVPMTSLAAILIVVSYNMGDWQVFKRLKKAPKSDAVVFLIAFFLTVLLDLVVAIGIGVVVASFLFMKRMADYAEVKCLVNEEDDEDYMQLINTVEKPDEISFYEIKGPFFFAAASKFVGVTKGLKAKQNVLILKMSKVSTIDATGYHELENLYEICKSQNTELIILKLKKPVLKVLEKYGYTKKLGKKNFCNSIEKAIDRTNYLLSLKTDEGVA
ncbi:sulfate permease [Clostridium sp. MB40-C1]|uniref:SulP family inorganic anion transporter n=1 Tax=Clostridium sp. MB40-C1 TaxID=3070996 RepID=UPI0027E08B11|nr:sulfate permease [Clostridium sp. MB40-C1]WMJ80784.1 sulfate permease [Clostridium sp. MB40-C1]